MYILEGVTKLMFLLLQMISRLSKCTDVMNPKLTDFVDARETPKKKVERENGKSVFNIVEIKELQ